MMGKGIQEYLETLYALSEEGKPAETKEIASRLGITPPSVTEMLKKLAKEGYVKYEPYHGVVLTKKGMKVAQKVIRKHRLLERFLTDILRIRKDRVHQQACELEHALSDEAEEALCRALHHPDCCPDDEKPIPPCTKDVASCIECREDEGTVRQREVELVPLSTLRTGQRAVIAFIRGGRMAVQRLVDMGLTNGTPIEVLSSAPFKGPIEILVRGSNLAIGRGLAAKIFVEVA